MWGFVAAAAGLAAWATRAGHKYYDYDYDCVAVVDSSWEADNDALIALMLASVEWLMGW